MSNLIKNELVKIFKKKSAYIILIITLVFIIFSNFMYKKSDNTSYSSYSPEMLKYYEEDLAGINPNDPATLSAYIETKTQIDTIELIKKYGFESWQANIIPGKLSGYIFDMNEFKYSSVKNEQLYNESKAKYDEIVEKLDADNWRYFAQSEIDEANAQIEIQESAKANTIDQIELASIESSLNYHQIVKQVAQWRLDKDISYKNSFLNNCLTRYADYNYDIYNYEHSDNHSYEEKQTYYETLEKLNKTRYYIENNISNIRDNDNRGILLNLFDNYELFILIFSIMIAGAIVSDEFNKGTIKLLLVRPYSRLKILFAKFIVCIIILLSFIAVVACAQFIVGGIVQGFDSTSIPAIIFDHNTNQIETMSIMKYIVITSIAKLPIYLLLMTLAFACSTIFTNTAVSIVLPLLGYMVSSLINQLALYYDIKPLLYFVTPNWDLTYYLFGGLPIFESLTLPFSIVICFTYFMIMVITTSIIFKKRNIKNI